MLAEVGLITRHRSEGDRRRSYVALVRDALDTLTPTGALPAAERVVFVCTHNSARSQLAAAMWNTASPVPPPPRAPTRGAGLLSRGRRPRTRAPAASPDSHATAAAVPRPAVRPAPVATVGVEYTDAAPRRSRKWLPNLL